MLTATRARFAQRRPFLSGKTWPSIYLFVFSISISFFTNTDDGRNYLVIALASISIPALLFVLDDQLLPDIAWVVVTIGYSACVVFVSDPVELRTTLGYTVLLAASYLAFVGGLRSKYTKTADIRSVLRWIIDMYAAIIIIQVIAQLAGLPMPNELNHKEAWSFNSLATEPSNVGRILSLTLLSYLTLQGDTFKSGSIRQIVIHQRRALIPFTIAMVFSGSALAAMAIPVTIILALSGARMVAALAAIAVSWPALSLIQASSVQRSVAFLSALPSLNVATIGKADGSGATRVFPSLIYFLNFTGFDSAFWFGSGYIALRQFRIPGVLQGEMAGIFPGYFIAFGLVGTSLLLLCFMFRFIARETMPVILLFIIFVSPGAWNTQVFWYGLMMIRVVHHYTRPAMRERRGVIRLGNAVSIRRRAAGEWG